MCGIAGYVGPVPSDRLRQVEVMAGAVAHRGPDDAGHWHDGAAALAHRRLSIIDTSPAGHQPMLSACGRYVLTYNGEIYNYLELRGELESRGVSFRGHSDSEVLLAAFVNWGEECVTHFNGMWAFAIWDREVRRLFVSRDRFGEKPLYYTIRNRELWFASEIKALLAADIVERTPNPRAVADFAAERASDHTEETFFIGVLQLPPACSAWWDGRVLTIRRYWSLPADDPSPARRNLAEEVESLLEDAVRLRLRSDVAVGTLLSGGLDSSSVACLAAQVSAQPMAAFSTIDRQPPEEAAGIEQVLLVNRGLQLYRDDPGDDCIETDMAQCLWHQEEPFADGSMLAHFRLMRLARQSGVRVLLTGQAADEVFAGYPGFQAIHLGGLVRRGQLIEVLSFLYALRASGQSMPISGLGRYALPASLSARIRQRKALRSIDWLAPDWRRITAHVAAGYAHAGGDAVNSALRACLTERTLPAFLHYEDRNSMAFGVETRIPFLDHRLVERVLPVPGAVKLAHGHTKAVLRHAMAGRVPKTITTRLTKEGYPAPLARWLRRSPASRQSERIEQVAACPFIALDAWKCRYASFMAGDDDELPAIWRGLILSLWHSRFIMQAL